MPRLWLLPVALAAACGGANGKATATEHGAGHAHDVEVAADAVDATDAPAEPSPAGEPPIALSGQSPPVWGGQWTTAAVLPAALQLTLGKPPAEPGWKGPVYPHYSAAQINDFTGDGVADLLLFTQGGDARLVVGPVSPESAVVQWAAKPGPDQRVHSAALWAHPDGRRWALLAGARVAAWRWDGATWVDEGDALGLPSMPNTPRYCAVPVDLDSDGLLDLVECRYRCHTAAEHFVWLDRGDGALEEQAAQLGLEGSGGQWGVGLTDLQGDGRLDLVWMHDGCKNPQNSQGFYVQQGRDAAGRPHFQRQAPHALFGFPSPPMPFASPMGLDTADFDGDGRDDLAIANVGLNMPLATAMAYLMTEDEAIPRLAQNLLLLQQAGGSYLDTGLAAGLKTLVDPVKKMDMVLWGVRALDFDRDGWVDLAFSAAADHAVYTESPRGPMRPVLLRNVGNGHFAEVSAEAGWPAPELAITLATGDLDGDGNDDAVLGQLNGQPIVLRNELTSPHHGIRFRLRGRTSNVLGVGARVTVAAGTVVRSRLHAVDAPMATHAELTTSFGVGKATSVTAEVRWPSGYVQALGEVATDQTVAVEEPALVTVSSRWVAVGQAVAVKVQLRTPQGGALPETPVLELVPPGALVWASPPVCTAQGNCAGTLTAVQPGTTYLHVSAPGLNLQVWPKITSVP